MKKNNHFLVKILIPISVGLVAIGAGLGITMTIRSIGAKDEHIIPDSIVQEEIAEKEDDAFSYFWENAKKDGDTDEQAHEKAIAYSAGLKEKIEEFKKDQDDYYKSKGFKSLPKQEQKKLLDNKENEVLGFIKQEERKMGMDTLDSKILQYEADRYFSDQESKQYIPEVKARIDDLKQESKQKVVTNTEANDKITNLNNYASTANTMRNFAWLQTVLRDRLHINNVNDWLAGDGDTWKTNFLSYLHVGAIINPAMFSTDATNPAFPKMFSYDYNLQFTKSNLVGSSANEFQYNNIDRHAISQEDKNKIDSGQNANENYVSDNYILYNSPFTNHPTTDTGFANCAYHPGEVLPNYYLSLKVLNVDFSDPDNISIQFAYGLQYGREVAPNVIGYEGDLLWSNDAWQAGDSQHTPAGGGDISSPNVLTLSSKITKNAPIGQAAKNGPMIKKTILEKKVLGSISGEWNNNTRVAPSANNATYFTNQSTVFNCTSTDSAYFFDNINDEDSTQQHRPYWENLSSQILKPTTELGVNADTIYGQSRTWFEQKPCFLEPTDSALYGVTRPEIFINNINNNVSGSVQEVNKLMNGEYELAARVTSVAWKEEYNSPAENQKIGFTFRWVLRDKLTHEVVIDPTISPIGSDARTRVFGFVSPDGRNYMSEAWVCFKHDPNHVANLSENKAIATSMANSLLLLHGYNEAVEQNNISQGNVVWRMRERIDYDILIVTLQSVLAAVAATLAIINMASYVSTLGIGVPLLVNAIICTVQGGLSIASITLKSIMIDKERNMKNGIEDTEFVEVPFANTFFVNNSYEQTQQDLAALRFGSNNSIGSIINKYKPLVENTQFRTESQTAFVTLTNASNRNAQYQTTLNDLKDARATQAANASDTSISVPLRNCELIAFDICNVVGSLVSMVFVPMQSYAATVLTSMGWATASPCSTIYAPLVSMVGTVLKTIDTILSNIGDLFRNMSGQLSQSIALWFYSLAVKVEDFMSSFKIGGLTLSDVTGGAISDTANIAYSPVSSIPIPGAVIAVVGAINLVVSVIDLCLSEFYWDVF